MSDGLLISLGIDPKYNLRVKSYFVCGGLKLSLTNTNYDLGFE